MNPKIGRRSGLNILSFLSRFPGMRRTIPLSPMLSPSHASRLSHSHAKLRPVLLRMISASSSKAPARLI